MQLKRIKLKTISAMALTAIMLGGVSTNTVLAMECQQINPTYKVSTNCDEISIDFSNAQDLSDFKYKDVEDGFTVELSDDVVLQRLADAGYDVSKEQKENNFRKMIRSARSQRGVTKFVKVKGGWDLYISSTLANIIVKGGGAAAGTLLAALPGIGWTLAGVVAGVVANQVSSDFVTFGIVCRYRTKTDKITISKQ